MFSFVWNIFHRNNDNLSLCLTLPLTPLLLSTFMSLFLFVLDYGLRDSMFLADWLSVWHTLLKCACTTVSRRPSGAHLKPHLCCYGRYGIFQDPFSNFSPACFGQTEQLQQLLSFEESWGICRLPHCGSLHSFSEGEQHIQWTTKAVRLKQVTDCRK